jgi:hypothetical protein
MSARDVAKRLYDRYGDNMQGLMKKALQTFGIALSTLLAWPQRVSKLEVVANGIASEAVFENVRK